MTPNSVFHDFLRDIEPSKTTKSDAASAHQTLRAHLTDHEDFGPVVDDTFLSGSYKRDTAIRPIRSADDVERPDVDVIVVTKHGLADPPAGVVESVYSALRDKYPNSRKQARSVGVVTARAEMDAAPLIQPVEGGHFYIADRTTNQWVPTNPPRHTQWTTDTNAAASGRFKPLVKLFKWWRRENKTVSKHPKGFVIECIVAECLDANESHYGQLFTNTLAGVRDRYRSEVSRGVVPYIPDPAGIGRSVTEGLTFDAFEGFYNKAKAHLILCEDALEASGDDATVAWRKVFGDRFPASQPGRKDGSLLGAATAAPDLTFPNRAIQPRKPGGFA